MVSDFPMTTATMSLKCSEFGSVIPSKASYAQRLAYALRVANRPGRRPIIEATMSSDV